MFMNLNTGTLRIANHDLPQTIDLARRHGFRGIDISPDDPALLADAEAAGERIRHAGLRVGGFGLPVQFRTDEATWQQGMSKLPERARRAQLAGCTRCATYLMPRHETLDYQANFDQHVTRLRPVAEMLAEHGIAFALEFVGTKTLRTGYKEFIHHIDQLQELFDAIDVPNVGVLLDSFHWYTSGGTVQDIEKKMAGKVVYVHVNDARAGRGRDEQIDKERALPCDTGVIDAAAFTRALRRTGYDGPVTAEPFITEFGEQPPEQVAAKVAASMRKILAV